MPDWGAVLQDRADHCNIKMQELIRGNPCSLEEKGGTNLQPLRGLEVGPLNFQTKVTPLNEGTISLIKCWNATFIPSRITEQRAHRTMSACVYETDSEAPDKRQ